MKQHVQFRATVHSRMESVLQQRRQLQQLRDVLSLVTSVTRDQSAAKFVEEECDMIQRTFRDDEDKQFVNENIDFNFNIYFDEPVEIWIDTLRSLNSSNVQNKFLFLLEPEPISGIKDLVLQQQQKFSHIFAWDTSILQQCPRSSLFEHGGTWILPSQRQQFSEPRQKVFKTSFICGGKNQTEGHRLRHRVWNRQLEIDEKTHPVAFFISGQMPTGVLNINNNKMLNPEIAAKASLFNCMFHICIENIRQENYFTEKLMDAIVTKTVPIYWGCPNIEKYFDVRGLILVSDDDDIIKVVNALNPEDYYTRLAFVEENFQRAQRWINLPQRIRHVIATVLTNSKKQ
jgi:hypothetical protein